MRNGEHIVCDDFTLDPRTLLWRPHLLSAGLKSSANFPLRRHGIVVGGLLLCATETGFFDTALVDLLLEMAANISFALDAMDRETQRRQAEERLAFLAQYDVLTGLPNRSLFRDRLLHALARAKRSGALVGLMFFDLDRFKQINDTLGHATGDTVLQAVAARLREHLREVDTISRLGGDEFTLIVEGATDADHFIPVAEKIRSALASPITVDGHEIFVSTSIGVTVYPRDAEEVDELLKNADIAMYRAKRDGRDTYLFYAPEMAAQTHEHLYLEGELRHALERSEFVLCYQPTMEVSSGRIVGVEALIRWNSQRGMVPPGEFIPIAEETGIILDIGAWVLREACAQGVAWQAMGLPPMQLNVNLAARQFVQHDLLETVGGILRDTGLPPRFLELEITESTIMHQGEGVIDTLDATESTRGADRDRRFRDRLLQPRLPQAVSGAGPQGRQVFRARHHQRSRRRRDRACGDRDGAQPGAARDRRRRRDRVAARVSAGAEMRRVPGLSVEPPAAGRGARGVRQRASAALISHAAGASKFSLSVAA